MLQLFYLAITITAVFYIQSLVVYLSHLCFHQSWSRHYFKVHVRGHHKEYPKNSTCSDAYRNPPSEFDGDFISLLAGALGVIFVALTFPRPYNYVGISFGMLFGLLNYWIHMQMHLSTSRLAAFNWFKNMRKLHAIHHRRMHKNFGLTNFTFDRLFGTFADV